MGAFADGWQVLQSDFSEVLIVAACVLWGGILAFSLGRFGRAELRPAEAVSLASTLWSPPALLLAAISLLGERWIGPSRTVLLLVALVALGMLPGVRGVVRHQFPGKSTNLGAAGLLATMITTFVVLRLAFVKELLLPQYFDSAAHYGLIRQLVQFAEAIRPLVAITLPAPPYYHIGFHMLIAALSNVTHLDIGDLVLVSGQLVLALTPLALYAPARRLSGSATSAFMAMTLAAFGWYMPAFAANWGKYPALFSVLPTLGAITVGLVAGQTPDEDARRRLWVAAAGVAVAAGLFHTRSVIALSMAAAAAGAPRLLWMLPAPWRKVAIVVTMLAILFLGWSILTRPALSPALEPYHGTGLGPTIFVGLLAIVGFKFRPRASLALFVFAGLLLAGLIVPFPVSGAGTLLDRPYVELWIFAPLSLLGALGLAGLTPYLGRRGPKAVLAISTAALGAHALFAYDLHASSCCTILTAHDLVAIQWLASNGGASDLVGIATETLETQPAPHPGVDAPVDAGAWVHPLTELGVVPLPRDLDLRAAAVVGDLCRQGVRYLYLGGSARGFAPGVLAESPARFTTRLKLPGASIIEVKCGN